MTVSLNGDITTHSAYYVKVIVARIWVEGHKGKQMAVIDNQIGRVAGKLAFSFMNLMEIRFVKVFVDAGVSLREIRRIMNEAAEILNVPHPFSTSVVFRTDGKKVVAEIAKRNGINIYDLKTKNYEMVHVVMASLKNDVLYNAKGDSIYWRPRKAIAPNVIVHPKFAFGKPILKQSRIPTNAIARSWTIEKNYWMVAAMFDIREKQVREAVAFEANLRQAA
jgi:uncharacterized protein (DUF433 family)